MARQQRAIRTRDVILRAAAQVVDRRGLTAATIARVSAEAGLSPGAIYFHFADKNALASALEQEAARALDELAAAHVRESAPTLTAIVEMTCGFAQVLTRDVVVRAGFQVSCDRAEGEVPALGRRFTGLLKRLLEDAGRDGSIAPGVTVDEISDSVVVITVGIQVLARRRGPAQRAARVLERFWHATLPGLLPVPPVPASPSTRKPQEDTSGSARIGQGPRADGPRHGHGGQASAP
ncbi:ScbR family autoregulator-binding transcription factor [Streptomyces sp. NPDC005576]|uniref:ScbR family autoregulator-binding transcription factor n=1 Tax=unclassified Streptomyces TaxID=2593676 RepID=UPI0033C36392